MGLNLLELAHDELSALTEKRTPQSVVVSVVEELGRQFIPTGRRVIVRTDPPVRVTPGGVFLTGRETAFYSGPAHAKILKCTVIAVGEKSSLRVGDRVCFQRLYFSRIAELRDQTFVGSIDEDQLVGYIEQE